MRYTVHYSGYYGFDIEVEAKGKEEAEEKADRIFDDVEPEDYIYDPAPTDVIEKK